MESVIRNKARFICVAFFVTAIFVLAHSMVLPERAQAAAAPDVKIVASGGKWTASKDGVSYTLKGEPVKGLVGIGGKTYYFNGKGIQLVGWRCVNGIYYRFAPTSKAKACATTGKVVNGVKLNKYGQAVLSNKNVMAELETMVRAQKLLDKLSNPLQGKSAKLKASYKYITTKVTERVLHPWSSKSGWWRLFANDVFIKKAGDCNSMGFAMAYLANAAGYSKCECVSSGGHSWARINGLVYDPQQRNYAVSGHAGGVNYAGAGVYHVNLNRSGVWPGKAIANAGVSAKKGLVKRNGAWYYYNAKGRMVTSKWVTVKGARYYCTKTGKAACGGAFKISGTYYIFNAKGKLQKGSGVRVVKVRGVAYQVTAGGKAKSGWNTARTSCFKKNGALCTGVELLSGKLTAFSTKGVYQEALTQQLQAAAQDTFQAQVLIELMGKPVKSYTEASCNSEVGPEGLLYEASDVTLTVYEYQNVRIQIASFKLVDDGVICQKLIDISTR